MKITCPTILVIEPIDLKSTKKHIQLRKMKVDLILVDRALKEEFNKSGLKKLLKENRFSYTQVLFTKGTMYDYKSNKNGSKA
jgi:hypothetical protein